MGSEFLLGSCNGVAGELDNSFSISSLAFCDKLIGSIDNSFGLGFGYCERFGSVAVLGSKGESTVGSFSVGNVSAVIELRNKDCNSWVVSGFGADFWSKLDINELWLFRL